MSTYTNNDGLTEIFGNPPDFKGGEKPVAGVRKDFIVYLDAVDVTPSSGTHADNDPAIPAGYALESAKIIVTEAFAGGTSINVGTEQSDGTVIDADGIDSAVATASLTANAVIDCDGAQVGSIISASNDGYIALTKSGTFTAGKATLVLTCLSV